MKFLELHLLIYKLSLDTPLVAGNDIFNPLYKNMMGD